MTGSSEVETSIYVCRRTATIPLHQFSAFKGFLHRSLLLLAERRVPLLFDNMLVFFALCAFLQTPLGASVPPSNTSSSAATPDAFGAMTCECPISSSDDGGEHLRTVYDIVKSCLLTIFACVWQSAHPNINGPRDSGWARLKRRIVTMLCMIIAPEAALVWALHQRSSAKEIAETYNKEFAKVGMWTLPMFQYPSLISKIA